jgi:hypothetical protein
VCVHNFESYVPRSRYLWNHGIRQVGVELSISALEDCERRNPRVRAAAKMMIRNSATTRCRTTPQRYYDAQRNPTASITCLTKVLNLYKPKFTMAITRTSCLVSNTFLPCFGDVSLLPSIELEGFSIGWVITYYVVVSFSA